MIELANYNLPNLFIPGAGKSGTSTLHELLNSHPDICMSSEKEPHFWTNPNFDNFSNKEYEKYFQLFNFTDSQIKGESSTGYLCFPHFKERIIDHYSELPKFIIILRNPIDRIYSHYWWLKGLGSENKSFRKAVLEDFNIEPSENYRLLEANFKNYFQFGLYGKWIEQFYNAFKKENILIITTESLNENRLKTLNNCFRFLKLKELKDIPEIENNKTVLLRFPKLYKYAKILVWHDFKLKRIIKVFFPKKIRESINKNLYRKIYNLTSTSKKYPKILESERQWLKDLYADDVNLLKRISGLNFSEWKDFN